MPELPEVEALAQDLRSRLVAAIARVDIAAFSALKTYETPLSALQGALVEDVIRHGKFLDVTASGLHLVIHLSRAGWIRWRDEVPSLPPKPSASGRWRSASCSTTERGSTSPRPAHRNGWLSMSCSHRPTYPVSLASVRTRWPTSSPSMHWAPSCARPAARH